MSGGGDSLAVLALTARHSHRPPLALIVDHQLQPGSSDVADVAARRAAALGGEPTILRWCGDKPATGVQAAARQARHRLLAHACEEAGISRLVLGHTRDDQAELVWMRVCRTASAAALAGMRPIAPAPVWPCARALSIERPLLNTTRRQARAILGAWGMSWHDDPANDDGMFERARVRAALARLSAGGFDCDVLAALADTAQRVDATARRAAVRRLRDTAAFDRDAGTAWVEQARALVAPPAPIAHRALAGLVAAVSGRTPALSHTQFARFADALRTGRSTTVGGVWTRRVGTSLCVDRDRGAALGRADGPATTLARVRVHGGWVEDGRFFRADGGARVWIGVQRAARVLFPDRPSSWSDVESAWTALGVTPCRHHVR